MGDNSSENESEAEVMHGTGAPHDPETGTKKAKSEERYFLLALETMNDDIKEFIKRTGTPQDIANLKDLLTKYDDSLNTWADATLKRLASIASPEKLIQEKQIFQAQRTAIHKVRESGINAKKNW